MSIRIFLVMAGGFLTGPILGMYIDHSRTGELSLVLWMISGLLSIISGVILMLWQDKYEIKEQNKREKE